MNDMSDRTPSSIAPQPTCRGLHKIFLGYAPGVGKTFAMLEEAHRRKRRGQDVVLGVIDSKGRPETAEEMTELETIPLTPTGELNVPQILNRRPQIVLVDDLEHTNAKGSERPKRWQDVEAILNAGIDVLSTVCVQNLESLNDHIRDITGTQIEETVPDQLLHAAGEIELVDVTPRALINRFERGVVFPAQTQDAITAQFFREGNLSALREIAMREAAGRVDEDLTAYRKKEHIEKPWATNDRVMICLTPNRNSLRLIRKGWRMGQRLRGEVVAVFVEQSGLSEAESKILKDDFALAQRLGIKTVTLKGPVAPQLIKYAKENSITQMLLGHPDRSRMKDLLKPTLVAELIKELRTVDFTLVAQDVEPHPAH